MAQKPQTAARSSDHNSRPEPSCPVFVSTDPSASMMDALERFRSRHVANGNAQLGLRFGTSFGWTIDVTLFAGEVVGETSVCVAVVCEDDAVLAAALTAVLAAHGFRVVARVDRGSDLLAVVREHEPAVVVVDAALLGSQGVGLLAQIRAASPATLVALRPPGLESLELGEDADAVVPGDDLRPLHRVLAGLAVSLCG